MSEQSPYARGVKRTLDGLNANSTRIDILWEFAMKFITNTATNADATAIDEIIEQAADRMGRLKDPNTIAARMTVTARQPRKNPGERVQPGGATPHVFAGGGDQFTGDNVCEGPAPHGVDPWLQTE